MHIQLHFPTGMLTVAIANINLSLDKMIAKFQKVEVALLAGY